MTQSMAKNATRMEKNNSAMATAMKKTNNKKEPNKESCGFMDLVQDILVLTRMYKLILCMVRDVHTITT